MTALIHNTWSNDRTWANAFTWAGDQFPDPGMVVGHRYVTRCVLTAAATTWRLATEDDVHGGEQWVGALQAQAELASQFVAGQYVAGQQFTLQVLWREAETDALFAAYAAGTLAEGFDVHVSVTTHLLGSDDTELVFDRVRYLTCTGIEVRDGVLSLTLADLHDARLDTLYPPRTYQAGTWPVLREDDAGKAIPRPVGTAVKLPAVHVDTDGSTYWDFAICEFSGTPPTVLTVYRDGRIVASSEYVAVTITHGGITVRAVRFGAEQLDYSGRPYTLQADVQTSDSRNVVDEIDRLLGAAGLGLTAHTASAARAYATQCRMLVDCDYGRDGQRTVRAILDDMLLLARAALVRDGAEAGKYALLQDRGDAPAAAFDQQLGDPLVVQRFYSASRPESVAVRYRPGSNDPSQLQAEIRRPVAGGTDAAQAPRDLRYVRDHETADRLACYLALRAQFARRVTATLHGPHADAGTVLTLTARVLPPAWRGFVVEARQRGTSLDIECIEDGGAVHVYTPGALPGDADDSYAPDYSHTPPAAPTALTITDGGSASGADRQAWSYVALQCVPPAVNWGEIWFVAIHAGTGEMAMARGERAGGIVRAVLNGLRSTEVYRITAYAVSPTGVDGYAQDVCDATFIGQSAAASTIIAPGSSIAAPAAPAGLVITSGGVAAGDDRRASAYITAEAELPGGAVEMWFCAVHGTTGERINVRGDPDTGIDYIATISGLRAGETYRLEVYAVGAFGSRGATATTVNAVAIGGSAAATTWTAPGTALGAPAAPTGLAITAAGVASGDDRRAMARITARFAPPAAGTWREGRLRAIHNSTGEVTEVTTRTNGSAEEAALTLRAGENYRLEGYVVNAFGIASPADNTADVTAVALTVISGTAAACTVWTSPGTAVGLPALPTSLTVTSSGTRRASDGGITAWCAVSASFGSGDVRETYFEIANNTTAERVILRGSAGSGTATATFTGLRAGEDHTLRAYGVNAFGAQGPAAMLSPVVASYTAAPATPASCSAAQGMGRVIDVSWPAVSDADLGDYELERRIGAGSYSVVWRGKTRSFVDAAVSYGTTYQYRVRARNTSGIYSGYATSSAVVLTTGTVVGGSSGNDIGTNTVTTANRSAVSTVSVNFSNPTLTGTSLAVAHSLGKVPICTANTGGKTNAWVNVDSVDSSMVYITVYGAPTTASPDEQNAASPHQHFFTYAAGIGTAYVDLW